MKRQTILIASHDAGGAHVLSHWCRSYESLLDFEYYLAGPAITIFQQQSLAGSIVTEYKTRSFDGVVTSTGWQTRFEKDVVYWAKQNDIPVASYLDHWVNYADRFDLGCLPNELWVPDQEAIRVAKNTFTHADVKIRLMKNRYFTSLKHKVKSDHSDLSSDHILICLEPIRNGYGLKDAYDTLSKYLMNHYPKNQKIVVRDHPSGAETQMDYLVDVLSQSFQVMESESTLESDLAHALAVFGYQSSVLAYANYLGMPAISYFPKDFMEPILPHKDIEYIPVN